MKFSFVYFIVLLFNLALFTSCKQAVPEKDFQRIRNDIFWDTQDGEPIFSRRRYFQVRGPGNGRWKVLLVWCPVQ